MLVRDASTEGRVAFYKGVVTLTSRHSLWMLVSVVGGDGGGVLVLEIKSVKE